MKVEKTTRNSLNRRANICQVLALFPVRSSLSTKRTRVGKLTVAVYVNDACMTRIN